MGQFLSVFAVKHRMLVIWRQVLRQAAVQIHIQEIALTFFWPCRADPSQLPHAGAWYGVGGVKLPPTRCKYGFIIVKRHCAAAAFSPIQAFKGLIYQIPLMRGTCLFEVAWLWNALKESLVPVRNAELKSWKEFGSFLMVLLQHRGASSAYLSGIAWHTQRQAQSGTLQKYLDSCFFSFLDVYVCVCGNKRGIFSH